MLTGRLFNPHPYLQKNVLRKIKKSTSTVTERLQEIGYKDFPVPKEIECPINWTIMNDPVTITNDEGHHSFERTALEKCKGVNPLTNQEFTNAQITSDVEMKKTIENYVSTLEQLSSLENTINARVITEFALLSDLITLWEQSLSLHSDKEKAIRVYKNKLELLLKGHPDILLKQPISKDNITNCYAEQIERIQRLTHYIKGWQNEIADLKYDTFKNMPSLEGIPEDQLKMMFSEQQTELQNSLNEVLVRQFHAINELIICLKQSFELSRYENDSIDFFENKLTKLREEHPVLQGNQQLEKALEPENDIKEPAIKIGLGI